MLLREARSWSAPQRVVCKAEASEQGDNVRFVVTNLESSRPSFIYEKVYCARGRMEGFIKNHKTFLLSDRTSCRTFAANHFRLFLHSAAYVLLHALERIGLRGTKYDRANFDTLRIRLLKIAARVQRTENQSRLPSARVLSARASPRPDPLSAWQSRPVAWTRCSAQKTTEYGRNRQSMTVYE